VGGGGVTTFFPLLYASLSLPISLAADTAASTNNVITNNAISLQNYSPTISFAVDIADAVNTAFATLSSEILCATNTTANR
jgi:uncharacterized membrane protein YfcA